MRNRNKHRGAITVHRAGAYWQAVLHRGGRVERFFGDSREAAIYRAERAQRAPTPPRAFRTAFAD